MLERISRTELARPQAGLANKQPRQLLIALTLLLVALTIVLVKDREFWFPSEEASESDAGSPNVPKVDSTVVPARTVQAPAARVAAAEAIAEARFESFGISTFATLLPGCTARWLSPATTSTSSGGRTARVVATTGESVLTVAVFRAT